MFQLINLMAVSSHTHKPTLNDFCVVLSRSIHQSNEFEFKIIAWRKLLRNDKPCQPRHAQGNSIITRCRRAFFYSVIHKQLARYSKVWSVLHQLHLSQKSRQSAQVLFCPSKWMSSPLFVPRSVVLEAGTGQHYGAFLPSCFASVILPWSTGMLPKRLQSNCITSLC